MYQTFFSLTRDPFPKDLKTSECFKSADFDNTLNRLEFLKQTKGFGLITAEPGMGKSFILRYFANALNKNLYKCIYIPISTLTVMDFYRALCYGLDLEPGYKKVLMFKQIQDAVYSLYKSKNITPVFLLDEAHFLKNSVLDDLRILFNFDMDSKDYAIVVLAGQTPLVSTLQRRTHDALKQRITMSYHLGGLSKSETKDYILSRLKMVGCHEPIFTDDAFELLFSSTNGCVRPLNKLTTMALIHAANKKQNTIDADTVYEASSEISITA